MWGFNNLNSGSNVWPPDTGQNQHPDSSVYPNYGNLCDCFPENAYSPSPGFGVHGYSPHLNPAFIQQHNQQALNHVNEPGRFGDPTPATKRFLVFDQSGDQTSLIYTSVASPYQTLNPSLPVGNATYECASSSLVKDHEDMHEDTEEIDALLYSDTEYTYDSDEASTGHSPLFVGAEGVGNHAIPSKRRKLDLLELDASLMDTACSASAPSFNHSLDAAAVSYVDSCDGSNNESGEWSKYWKWGRIQMTMDLLRSIVPGGEGKDTTALLDEAIQYLKSLKLQAKAVGATCSTI